MHSSHDVSLFCSDAKGMRTGAKLGTGEKASTSKGTLAKTGSKKIVAPEAVRSKPCSQNTAAKQGESSHTKLQA